MSTHSSSDGHYPEGDPFSDGQPRIQFQEPSVPRRNPTGNMPTPFQSSTSLPQEFGGQGFDEEEKIPLTGDQGFVGGLYPPGYADLVSSPFPTPILTQTRLSLPILLFTVVKLIQMPLVTPTKDPCLSCPPRQIAPILPGAAVRPSNVV
jgi:hypothetical protein